MGLHTTLTIRSRSNLASPMDTPDVVSCCFSIHFICLTWSDKMLQADIAVFNGFLTESYLTLIWPFRSHSDLPQFVHLWVTRCNTIYTGNRLQKCHKVSTPSRNENIWKKSETHVIQLGDILNSCDLNVGHRDLQTYMLVHPKVANNNVAETFWLLASKRFVP